MAKKEIQVKFPSKVTASSMVQYVAEKNQIPRKLAKEIIDDIFNVIQAGVMNGDRVPVGKFGKIFIRVRPATKARKGRNPLTGLEMTIPPKKATKVPKFTFAKSFKAEALKAKVVKK
jgi:nucleoid DNA-binding protein